MKNSFRILAVVLFLTPFAFAVQLEIGDPCANRSKLKFHESLVGRGPSVGEFTLNQLRKNGVPFVGTVDGLSSILGTPTADVEKVSSNEFYAYGWCYELNRVQPALQPGQVRIQRDSDLVYWFYGYAHFKNGQWLTVCEPAYTRPSKAYCRKSLR